MENKTIVREFETTNQVLNAVRILESNGVENEYMYVLVHEKSRTEQIADQAGINTIGLKEEGLGTALQNLFESEGDKLRNKMEEMGLSQAEVDVYEKKLDLGKILLFVKGHESVAHIL
jgi:hypothetical protein